MKVLLLAGGDSNERAVSLRSGKAVYEALNRLGHEVHALDPSSGQSLLTGDGAFIDDKKDSAGKSVALSESQTWTLTSVVGAERFKDIEVVFITLHGGSGENGKIQCLLDLAGKKYTGSKMAASAIAMDKAISKRLCVTENIPTPTWALYRVRGKKVDESIATDIARRFEFPLIVKPNDGGSTIGLTKVHSEAELAGALERSLAESREILVEQFIPGREVTVSVIDGEPLPLVEIRPKNELYDYEAKYTKGKSEYIVPAPVEEKVAKIIQQAAVKACEVVGASGLARVDFILNDKNEFYFLEVNTLPGMTELSLAPMAAKAAGISFDQLVARCIKSALER